MALHTRRKIYFSVPSIIHYDVESYRNSPARFVPVSVTGTACALKCAHCNGRLLESMLPALTPDALLSLGRELAEKGCRGLLLSGGARRDGSVPLEPFLGAIRELTQGLGLRVAVHTGIVSGDFARALAETGIEAAMIDVVVDPEVARRVCHVEGVGGAYLDSVRYLVEARVPTVPHVVLGLDYGRISSEDEALRALAHLEIEALVLVVLMPLPGTEMEGLEPPKISEVGGIFSMARALFPGRPVFLGCARPWGEYRREVERLALQAGFDGIAYPSEETIGMAEEMGLVPVFSEVCCALSMRAGRTGGPVPGPVATASHSVPGMGR